MPWTDQYIKIPFKVDGRDRDGIDCGGLVILVYREMLGIELPDYHGAMECLSIEGMKRASRTITAELNKWKLVDRPEEFDVIAFRRGKINQAHVGVYCGRRDMLHICAGINATVEEYNGLLWKHRLNGFYRYER